MIASMTAVFIIVYVKTLSLRLAVLIMLIVGTKWTILLSLFGFDRPLIQFYLINRYTGVVKLVSISVCTVITIAYVLSMIAVIAWPWIVERMPREIRREIRRAVVVESHE